MNRDQDHPVDARHRSRRARVAAVAGVALSTGAALLGCGGGDDRCGVVDVEPTAIEPGPGRWADPQRLATWSRRVQVPEPQVAFDGAGTATVAWTEEGTLCARQYVASGAWSAAAVVASGADVPRLAADDDGNVTAVWAQGDGEGSRVGASRFTPGAGWSAPAILSEADASAVAPAVASGPGGRATALWSSNEPAVRARVFDPATGWGPSALLATGDISAGGVDVATVAGGAIAVWHQWDQAVGWAIRASRLDGREWQPAQVIGSQPSVNPRVAVDGAGRASVGWYVSEHVVMWTRDRPDGAWDVATPVNAETEQTVDSFPQLASSASGANVVVWGQYDQHGTYDVWGRRYLPGAGWDAQVLIDSDATASSFAMAVALDRRGDGAVLLMEDDGDGEILRVRRIDAVDGWQPAEVLAAPPIGVNLGQVAFAADGRGLAVWEAQGTVWASVYRPPADVRAAVRGR